MKKDDKRKIFIYSRPQKGAIAINKRYNKIYLSNPPLQALTVSFPSVHYYILSVFIIYPKGEIGKDYFLAKRIALSIPISGDGNGGTPKEPKEKENE